MESVLPTVQEFQPSVETVQEEDCDTILLYLPGFKKEQLRVQLTRTRNLIISGERRLENQNVLSRFRKEFPASTNVDINKISAKFEGSILFIRMPKLITPAGISQQTAVAPKPPVEPAMPQKPVAEPQPEKKVQEQVAKIAKPLQELNDKVKQETKTLGEEIAQKLNSKDSKKAQEQVAKIAKPLQELNEKVKQETKALGEEIAQKLNSKDSKNAPDQVAAKKEKGESSSGLEGEKSDITGGDGKMAVNANRASDSIVTALKKHGEADDGGKKTLENYRQSVGGLASKLKKPRKAMNVLVVVLMALILGIYVTNYFKSGKTEEIAEL